jgi:hypothetical protein
VQAFTGAIQAPLGTIPESFSLEAEKMEAAEAKNGQLIKQIMHEIVISAPKMNV